MCFYDYVHSGSFTGLCCYFVFQEIRSHTMLDGRSVQRTGTMTRCPPLSVRKNASEPGGTINVITAT